MSRINRLVAVVFVALSMGVACVADPVHAGGPTPAAPAVQTYTVKAGDYLTGIAARLGVRLSDLLTVNKLTVNSLIYPGMKLVVPAGGTVPGVAPTASAQTYTVKAGDYLSGIAARMGVKLSSLLTVNKLTATSLIHPGMKLVVPVGGTVPAGGSTAAPAPAAPLVYVVRSGDYLSGIAPLLGVRLNDLLTVNKLSLGSLIYPGMRLTVPAGGTLPPAAAVVPTNTAGSAKIAKVLAFATAQKGEPYKFNAAGPDSWDCSGLTMAAYAEIGISLPHYSGAQVNYGTVIDWNKSAIKAGDLVYLESAPGTGVISHVGIAVNATQWITAPRTGDVVRVGTIPMYRVVAVRRLVQG